MAKSGITEVPANQAKTPFPKAQDAFYASNYEIHFPRHYLIPFFNFLKIFPPQFPVPVPSAAKELKLSRRSGNLVPIFGT